jgi:site-specific DNA recombinase
MLASNTNIRTNGTSAKHPSLLAGLLFDEAGNRFVATHATKNGKRYRYYVSESASVMGVGSVRDAANLRLPAGDIEPTVIETIARALCDEQRLLEKLGLQDAAPAIIKQALAEAKRLATTIAASASQDLKALLSAVVGRIVVDDNYLRVHLRGDVLLWQPPRETSVRSDSFDDRSFVIEDAITFSRKNDETRLIIEKAVTEGNAPVVPDATVVKATARGYVLFEELTSGRTPSIEAISQRENVTDRYVSRLIDRALQHPGIVENILWTGIQRSSGS